MIYMRDDRVFQLNNGYRSEKLFLLLYGVLVVIISKYVNNDTMFLTLLLPILLLTLKKVTLSLYFIIAGFPVISSKGAFVLSINILFVFLFFLFWLNNNKLPKHDLLFFSGIIIISLFSLWLGRDTDIVINGIFIVYVLLFFITKLYIQKDGPQLLVYALFISAFVLISLIFTNAPLNESLLYGRLAVFDSIRTLANTIVPALLFATYFLVAKVHKSKIYKGLNVILFLILLSALLMTVSRGAIFAYVVGAAIIVFTSKNRTLIKVFFIMFSLYAIFTLLEYQGIIRISRLLNASNIEGLSGRSNIWTFYLSEYFSQNVVGILFGFGPGDLYRVSGGIMSKGAYAHSVPLDFLFSYGVIGFSLFLFAIVKLAKRVIRTRNGLVIAVFTTTLLLYSTHGSTTSRDFFILLALVFCLAENAIKQQRGLRDVKFD